MMNFVYQSPIRLNFGVGKADAIGAETAPFGKRAMVVTGGRSTRESGLLDRCLSQLRAEGIAAVVFDKVQQNPLSTTVMEGAALARQENCDVVVGLGGGSAIDSAKAIAFMARNGGDVMDYVFGRASGTAALPVIAVPTTCGTGTEGNGFAILTDPATHDKRGLVSPAIRPVASIIDPALMTTMPRHVAESVIFDAFCHCMEGRLSSNANDMSVMMDEEGMRRIYRYGAAACTDPSDLAAWEAVTFASTLGGLSLASAGSVAAHGIEHPLSGLYNIMHGRGLAAISGNLYALTLERDAGLEAFAAVSRCIGGKDYADFSEKLSDLQDALHIRVRLGEEGVRAQDIPWLVDNCRQNAKGNLAHHPTPLSDEDLAEIYRRSL